MRRQLVLLFALIAAPAIAAEPLTVDTARPHQGAIGALWALPEAGTLVTAAADVSVRGWSLRDGSQRWSVVAGHLSRHTVAPDGTLLLGFASGTVILVEPRSGREAGRFSAHWAMTANGMRPSGIDGLAATPDGRWLVTSGMRGPLDLPEGIEAYSEDAAVTRWFPVDPAQRKPLDEEVGAVGTDPPDDAAQPAQEVPGTFLGLRADGAALVSFKGAVLAWQPPDHGGGSTPAAATDAVAADADAVECRVGAWTYRLHGDGGSGIRLARRGPVAAADIDLGALGARGAWIAAGRLFITVDAPASPDLHLAHDIPLNAGEGGGAAQGSRLAVVPWPEGGAATAVPFGAPTPFAAWTMVRTDGRSVWFSADGSVWYAFDVATARPLAQPGPPPPANPGTPYVTGELSAYDYHKRPGDLTLAERLNWLTEAVDPLWLHADTMGRSVLWGWLDDQGRWAISSHGHPLRVHRLIATQPSPDDDPATAQRTVADLILCRGHDGSVLDACFAPDLGLLATASADGTIGVWRLTPRWSDPATAEASAELLYRRAEDGRGAWLAVAPDGTYAASRGALGAIRARRGADTFPFAQVELAWHRPDRLMERVGMAPAALIAAYRRAWELRVRRQGLDPARLAPDAALPEVRLLQDVPGETADDAIELRVRADDPAGHLARVLVYADGAPVPDVHGTPAEGASAERRVRVPLAHGRNRIAVSALSAGGAESLRLAIEVVRRGEAVPRLVGACIGVSDYRNDALDLRYAASDARAMAEGLRGVPGFAANDVAVVVDGEASSERLVALRARFAATAPGDVAVLFLAGHGFLDRDLGYWFGTPGIDPDDPAAAGLAWHAIEALLDGIPARRRIILLDTCHGGEVDTPAKAGTPAVAVAGARGLRALGLAPDELLGLMRDTFVDLRRGTGAVVIAASAGDEVAYEGEDWKGGAFTRALLDGLRDPAADRDRDGRLSVLEWRAFALGAVAQRTGGRQKPMVRADNLDADFAVRAAAARR